MKYTDIRGTVHELELSEFTKNELRLYELEHAARHKAYENGDAELECWCDEETDAEDYADARLEASYR